MATNQREWEIVRTEVDGVPALWLPGSGHMHAGLVFRVGRGDESVARGGVTHLIEHLVLHRAGISEYHANGVTGPITTTFYAHGASEQIARFLTAVCAALRDLPEERLETEKDILRTEASGRRESVGGTLRRWRYGPAGHGLSGYSEFGLGDLTIADLRAWSAQWFTKGNAVLWIAGGPPPDGVRLELPDGPRRPAPPANSTVLPRTPAYFTGDVNGVGFDAVVPRGAAASAFAGVLERRLAAVLRNDLGLSYTTVAGYEPHDGAHALLTAFADALPERRGEVAGPFVDVLVDLARGVSGADDLRALRARREEAMSNPDTGPALLQSTALSLLSGYPVQTVDELRAELAALTPGDISRVAKHALGTGLIVVPPGQAVGRAGFTQAPLHSASSVSGQAFRLTGHGEERWRLVVGSAGVSLINGPDTATVHFDECAGMLSYPDGGRVLFAPDAVAVAIEPRLWGMPPPVVALIDQKVAPDRVAHMPARGPEEIPTPEVSSDESDPGRPAAWAGSATRAGSVVPEHGRRSELAHHLKAIAIVALLIAALLVLLALGAPAQVVIGILIGLGVVARRATASRS